jgi:phosphopantetheine--protein transferase-like protein
MGLGDKRLDGDEAKKVEMFRLMKRQFTQDEWMQIQSKDKGHQLAAFFRFWCLKESYVKGLGTGLGWELQRLSFVVKSECTTNDIVKDTQLYIDSELVSDWAFEETLLDCDRCVTTALNYSQEQPPALNFSLLTCESLLNSLHPLDNNCDDDEACKDREEWLDFQQKI